MQSAGHSGSGEAAAERNGARATLAERRNQCRPLDSLLEGVRSGRSRALVLRGEAGVGMSTLLKHLLDRAAATSRYARRLECGWTPPDRFTVRAVHPESARQLR
ncbi:ATP-binding protein [Streptomyces althioticus]|uniref:ATP-binding protein n=1 Tax=Streptomyces althioticus TaxID=83380 RepID=UPI003679FC4F